jgi:hypothetical protein
MAGVPYIAKCRQKSSFRAVAQTFQINAMKRSGTLRGSCRENGISNFRHSFDVDAKLAKFELT